MGKTGEGGNRMAPEFEIEFRKAKPSDAEALAGASERAFHDDVNYGAPGPPGGPPGYNSAAWQARMMRFGEYYTILAGERIIGGMIVFRQGTREYELGRIFIEPDFQNQGIGTSAFEFLWKTYPLAKRWTLGTPKWNRRTRHFYAKVGFSEIGEDAHGGVLFERRITPLSAPGAARRRSGTTG
jgi:RimJ/RimL family protein N-acetyltransferase